MIKHHSCKLLLVFCLAIVLLLPLSVCGQFQNDHTIFQSELSNVVDVATAEVSGDTLNDLLVVSEGNQRFAWYKNKGENRFGQQRIISDLLTNPTKIHPVDVNQDGLTDLITVSRNGRTVSWFENSANGFTRSGTFKVEYRINPEGLSLKLDLGYVNGDTLPDLVYTNQTNIFYRLNEGDRFTDKTKIGHISAAIEGLTVADPNNEPYADVWLTVPDANKEISQPGTIFNIPNDSASFDSMRVVQDSLKGPLPVIIEDVRGDSTAELLTTDGGSLKIYTYQNRRFSDSSAASSIHSIGVNKLRATDVDRDGNTDLIGINKIRFPGLHPSWAVWYENKGGRFEELHTIDSLRAASMTVGNISGDSAPELISGLSGINNVVWYPNTTKGFGTHHRLNITTVSHPSAVKARDLDGDDDTDIIASSVNDGKLLWFEQTDSVEWASHTIRSSMLTKPAYFLQSRQLQPLALADLTLDSNPEIVSTRPDSSLLLFPNKEGTFPNSVILDQPGIAKKIEIADVNGDQRKDIVMVSSESFENNLFWYKQPSDGFTAHSAPYSPQTIEKSSHVQSLEASDLNRDGTAEILMSKLGSPSGVFMFIHKEDNSWSKDTVKTYPRGLVFDAHAVELNGDRYKDLILGRDFNKSPYLLNKGGLKFSQAGKLSVETPRVESADIDRDADQDVITYDYPNLYRHENNDSTFSRELISRNQVLIDVGISNFMSPADVDGDSDEDLVVASAKNDRIFWYNNTSKPTAISEEKPSNPNQIRLKQNYPNPFNPSTTISFILPKVQKVTVTVYNTVGQKIEQLVDKRFEAGRHSVTFDATNLSSGMYIYQLKTKGVSKSRKMLLLK